MKKWMAVILVGTVTAGLAMAEETKVPWYKKMFGKNADEQTQVIPAAPAPEAPQMKRPEGMGEKFMQMSPEQKEQMKANHEALMKLGEAARTETDPVKKEALIKEIRAKVTEVMDKDLAEKKKRLEQAETDMPKLKERLADAEKNKAARIEERVKQIVSGEMPKHDGKHLEGLKKEGKKEGKKLTPPAAE